MASQYPLNEEEVDNNLEDEETTEEEELNDSASESLYSAKNDVPEDFSVAARQRLRDELTQQIEAYLARGGHIHEVPSSLNNTQPKKPVSDYGDSLM